MSTTPRAVPRALLAHLIDDAAVFPPGSSPVPRAWDEHLALRAGPLADLLGPLLIGAADAAQLTGAATRGPGPGGPVPVVVVARAGTDIGELGAAAAQVRRCPQLQLAGVELAHDGPGAWRQGLRLGVPLTLELPRGDEARDLALLDLLRSRPEAPVPVRAKVRTQATDLAPAPTAAQLADTLTAAHRNDLPVKLTGGLHHAVADPAGRREGHGVLNVLLAVHHLVSGAGTDHLVGVLGSTDGPWLAGELARLSAPQATAVRARFVGFGCCGVTDPIDELVQLGVLAPERSTA